MELFHPTVAIPKETLLYRVDGGHMKVAESQVPVYQGRLMSPNEVRTAMYQRGGVLPHRYQQSWYLCGDVCEEFFQRVARHEKITHSVTIFSVNGSTFFAVFCLQICEHQTRFLLPFASEKSVRFVEQVERTGVFMSLGRAGTEEALLLEFVVGENQLRDLRAVAKRCSRLPCDVDINELKMASYSMTHASSIPNRSAASVVSEVCVNVILDD
jgi:hypothetical protein